MGLSIASLVVGIIGLYLSWIPVIHYLVLVLGIIGVVFGIITLVKKSGKKAFSIAGLACSALAIVATLASGSAYVSAVNTAVNESTVSTTQDNSTTSTTTNDNKADYELSNVTDESNGYSRYIVGDLKNTSGKTMSYVTIEYGLYDSNGTKLGSAYDYCSNLAPGETWRFRALATEDSATQYKLVGVRGTFA